MQKIINIIENSTLEYHEKIASLAYEAESQHPYVEISNKSKNYLSRQIICDIFEGNAPFRPRYILPDYAKYFKTGSQYLDITPPKDMYEAINSLLTIYKFIPSITRYPVYIGQLDELLEPFVTTVTYNELYHLLKMFLTNIDRTLPDAFVHANIGPNDTKVGRLILELESELLNAVPNLSLKYHTQTPPELIVKAINTASIPENHIS